MISVCTWLFIGPGKMPAEQFHSNYYHRELLQRKFYISLLFSLPADVLIVYFLLAI